VLHEVLETSSSRFTAGPPNLGMQLINPLSGHLIGRAVNYILLSVPNHTIREAENFFSRFLVFLLFNSPVLPLTSQWGGSLERLYDCFGFSGRFSSLGFVHLERDIVPSNSLF